MARLRFVDPLRLDELKQTQLYRVVSIGRGGLALHNGARTRFEQSDRDHLPVRPEHLRHADFSSQNSWSHISSSCGAADIVACHLPQLRQTTRSSAPP